MPHKRVDSLSGQYVYADAKRIARYGHHDWLVWTGKDGIQQGRRLSVAAMKECLLAMGTQGQWSLVGSDGISMVGRWRMGINLLSQYRYGIR